MPSNEKPDLWRVITSCGLEQDFEYDRKGRVIHKRTRLVVRADMSPELVRTLLGARDLVQDAQRGAVGAVAAARQAIVAKLLANAERE